MNIKQAEEFGYRMGKLAQEQYKAPEPKLPNVGSNSILYTPQVEQFPSSYYARNPGPPREQHSAPAYSGEPRTHMNYAPTPQPWQPPKLGPYDPPNVREYQARDSRGQQQEDNYNFANPFGHRVPDPEGFRNFAGQFFGDSPKGTINLYPELRSRGWPTPPSQARPKPPFSDRSQYRHLSRPPFTMPSTPTSDLQ